MRNLPLFLLFLSFNVNAQKQWSHNQYRYAAEYSYSMPLGQFASGNSDRFYAGQCLPMSGANFYIGAIFHAPFALGVRFSQTLFPVDGDKLYTQLSNRFTRAGYYTTININDLSYSIGTIALDGSYMFHTPIVDIEPYLLIGAGYNTNGRGGDLYSVRHKQMNTNYSDDLGGSVARKGFFYPGAGLRINRKVWKIIYITAGIQYNYGVSRCVLNEQTTDFLGNESSTRTNFSQPISVLQIKAGLEVRFRAKRHFKTQPEQKQENNPIQQRSKS